MTDNPRVLLMVLSERTSARGTTYLAGWLGKAKVVAFRGKELDRYGNPTWELFVSDPAPKREQQQLPARKSTSTVIDGEYTKLEGPPPW